MKILALADRKITEDLPQLIQDNNIELVLLLGDLKYIEILDLAEVNIPIIGILGNHCGFDYLPNLKGINCHLNNVNINNLNFFGYQGCPYYKGGQFESTQEDCFSLIQNHAQPCDILISHSPASGINSTSVSPHEGFNGLLWYLDTYSPKFFFHGHSYPSQDQKISKYKETTVIFVEGVEIFNLDLLTGSYPKACDY